MKRIALLIEPQKSGRVDRKEIIIEDEDELDFFYKHIDCRCVELVKKDKGDIWIDEEGFTTNDKIVSHIDEEYTLAGNMLITKGGDKEGNTIFFNESDRELIEYWKNVPISVSGYIED